VKSLLSSCFNLRLVILSSVNLKDIDKFCHNLIINKHSGYMFWTLQSIRTTHFQTRIESKICNKNRTPTRSNAKNCLAIKLTYCTQESKDACFLFIGLSELNRYFFVTFLIKLQLLHCNATLL
jgi:hypothetical protein